ncbi:CMGC/DYRK/PRP4 protein kinase Prp4 [Schizosaccharomyces cryophilus OY26]|uniref:non-specific serine/threonine protein kinase n=1 Tax=Schizosaccharomyces cryophilus (strain OY26 / ATCC MYA-4695 / CBS 11777 / NBRC 106824 / NRRL Y48691) TaxID=653667 RepID=S9XC21_SCHCR|nr:CMGC/DYRK/PRP4 protein kinase Prp4 [Schizosaccharomyces cryophilus OY26]EPY51341.1 CMGC/DYRK/PRP4 protein kinase Prp4 [Schizosaccharomyces cryophilus OY26]
MNDNPLTEDEIIEQRRKRRLEILKKHQVESSTNAPSRVSTEDSLTSEVTNPFSKPETSRSEDERRSLDGQQPNGLNDSSLARPVSNEPFSEKTVNENEDDEEDDMFADTPSPSLKKRKTEKKPSTVKRSLAGMQDTWDDIEGYYKVILMEELDSRYVVQSNLGKGMFSSVVNVMDQKTKASFAIKIIRNNEVMYKAGMKEVSILERLQAADPEGRRHIIRYDRYFMHKNHLCMVFEMLSLNLRDILKKFGRNVGLNIKAIQVYAYQMFTALCLLEECNVIHADIKPDNMLVNEKRNILKICDLGSASDASENEITPYLVSRFYRAPEIILGYPYSCSIDTWSVGCSLFELYAGQILFPGRSNNQMLRLMMECKGKFSHKMLKRSQFTFDNFDEDFNFINNEIDPVTGQQTQKVLNFSKPVRDIKSRLKDVLASTNEEVVIQKDFILLLEQCLELNPEKRITPKQALKHPFFRNNQPFR